MSIPDIWIERVHLGEGTEAMEQAIREDPLARARLESLAEADGAFRARFEPSHQLAEIRRKLHVARTADAVTRRKRGTAWLATLVPLAAALVALFVVIPGGRPDDAATPPSVVDRGDRPKMRPAVLVFQRTARGPEKVSSGEVFHEGAELQLGYASPTRHGVLVSVDGRGAVTVHMPDGDDTSMEPGRHTLDHGYKLDDAPRFERFFLVMSDEPLSVDEIVTSAETLAASGDPLQASLDVPRSASVVDFHIKKVSR